MAYLASAAERLDPWTLERALAAVLEHHDALRLRFTHHEAGEWTQAFAASEGALYDVLRRAQAEGRLDPGHDARALARFFLAVSRSLALIHRSLGDERYMRDVARSALLALDAPPADERASAS